MLLKTQLLSDSILIIINLKNNVIMKGKSFFEKSKGIIVILLMFTLNLSAQIKVESIGRVQVGPQIGNITSGSNDPYNVANLQVFGKNDPQFGSGSKLTFGDFGRQDYYGWNVFIGEYGATDSDQLWLHGKLGTYFTHSSGTVWGYYDANTGNRVNFNCDVYSSGLKLTSDEKLKENIRPLTSSLSSLQKLNGVSYYLKKPIMRTSKDTEEFGKSSSLSDKEKRDVVFFEQFEDELQNSKDLRIGFVAQELKKVFPELVSEDKEGMLSVDYIGLIPVIVESIKEQQILIDELRSEVIKLKENSSDIALRSSSNTTGITEIGDPIINQCKLYQNAPNPFNISTQIKFFIPENVNSAYLYIYDLQGKQIKNILIKQRGESSQIISGSELVAGMYLFSLIVNGYEVDTKRMILTK